MSVPIIYFRIGIITFISYFKNFYWWKQLKHKINMSVSESILELRSRKTNTGGLHYE